MAKQTHSPTIDDAATCKSEEQRSIEVARLAYSVEMIQFLQPNDVLRLQKILSHGTRYGFWYTPAEHLSAAASRESHDVDLRGCISSRLRSHGCAPSKETEGLLTAAVLCLSRYLLLLRMGPAGIGRALFKSLKSSTVYRIAYIYGPELMAVAIKKCLEADSAFKLSLVTDTDVVGLKKSAAKVRRECDRIRLLEAHNLWEDCPAAGSLSFSDAVTGAAKINVRPGSTSKHLLYPDEFIGQIGERGLWFIRDLGPNLLIIAEKLAGFAQWIEPLGYAPDTASAYRVRFVSKLLSDFKWVDSAGKVFTMPPFPIRLPKPKGFGTGEEHRWPPKNFLDIAGLLGALQGAHIHVGLLSMGARVSEMASLQRSCVAYGKDGVRYGNGRTYKLVRREGGADRDWPLPDIAVEAFEQQVRLVGLCEIFLIPARKISELQADPLEPGERPLFTQISAALGASDSSEPLIQFNKALRSFAKTVGVDLNPGGQRIRTHRYRKTLARLVALALTQAPKLLMDLFGHTNIEMTLYYILTDKELAAEIAEVTRELAVMRGKQTVEKMVAIALAGDETPESAYGGFGGLGAIRVWEATETYRSGLHSRGIDWGANSALELGELLTLQGRSWHYVRPGVICTKFPGEAGPCNKKKGHPEPSKCSAACTHRLEEGFLRADVDGVIRDALAAYEKYISEEEPLMAANWAGQLRANISRFPDLKAKWMLNPTIRSVMQEAVEAAA